jgi:hypothetical protein
MPMATDNPERTYEYPEKLPFDECWAGAVTRWLGVIAASDRKTVESDGRTIQQSILLCGNEVIR